MSQNLVPNGDFEDYSSCPIGYSSPFQNPPEIEKCTGWTHPTYGTSDYFNQCANGNHAGINSNTLGYQEPFSGNGYLGAYMTSYTGGAGDDGYSGIMWWEYIQSQLTQPMVANHTYHIGMYVSLAEYSDLIINEFGVYFSNNAISSVNTASLNVIPQVIFNDSDYFNDTIDWMYVEGTYEALGGEEYITIGNFNDNLSTDTIRRYDLGDDDYNPFVTYFFFDNMSVTDITDSINNPVDTSDLVIPNVFSPNGDGNNDVFKFNASVESMLIFNRWGQKVFETSLPNNYWDGRTNAGLEVTDGTYYYIIETEKEKRKGFVQVVR